MHKHAADSLTWNRMVSTHCRRGRWPASAQEMVMAGLMLPPQKKDMPYTARMPRMARNASFKLSTIS